MSNLATRAALLIVISFLFSACLFDGLRLSLSLYTDLYVFDFYNEKFWFNKILIDSLISERVTEILLRFGLSLVIGIVLTIVYKKFRKNDLKNEIWD